MKVDSTDTAFNNHDLWYSNNYVAVNNDVGFAAADNYDLPDNSENEAGRDGVAHPNGDLTDKSKNADNGGKRE